MYVSLMRSDPREVFLAHRSRWGNESPEKIWDKKRPHDLETRRLIDNMVGQRGEANPEVAQPKSFLATYKIDRAQAPPEPTKEELLTEKIGLKSRSSKTAFLDS